MMSRFRSHLRAVVACLHDGAVRALGLRLSLSLLGAGVAGLGVFVLSVTHAQAATAATAVDLSPVVSWGLPILATVLTGLGGWGVQAGVKASGVTVSAQQMALLNLVIDNCLHAVCGELGTRLNDASWLHPNVKDPVVAQTLQMVTGTAPQLAAAMGLTPDALSTMISGRLAKATGVLATPPVMTPNAPAMQLDASAIIAAGDGHHA